MINYKIGELIIFRNVLWKILERLYEEYYILEVIELIDPKEEDKFYTIGHHYIFSEYELGMN